MLTWNQRLAPLGNQRLAPLGNSAHRGMTNRLGAASRARARPTPTRGLYDDLPRHTDIDATTRAPTATDYARQRGWKASGSVVAPTTANELAGARSWSGQVS